VTLRMRSRKRGHGVSRQVGQVGQDGLMRAKFDGCPKTHNTTAGAIGQSVSNGHYERTVRGGVSSWPASQIWSHETDWPCLGVCQVSGTVNHCRNEECEVVMDDHQVCAVRFLT